MISEELRSLLSSDATWISANMTIILRKYEASDIFTGNMDELIDFHDKKVSKQSIMEMARLAGLHVIEGVWK